MIFSQQAKVTASEVEESWLEQPNGTSGKSNKRKISSSQTKKNATTVTLC